MRRAVRIAALLGLFSSVSVADVIYVDASAAGADDGTSWTDAFTDLQDGIAAAVAGDEVWVAAAVYTPTSTTDRTIAFVMKADVGIYGGFDGTETQRTERDPAANLTVLDGDIGAAGVASDNSYHVVLVPNTVALSGVLDGFTIRNGRADGLAVDNTDRGGGMWINGGSPTLQSLIVSGNFASFEGGGLRVTSGNPLITGALFQSNTVSSLGAGAGLKSGGGSNVTCRNCVFRQNSISGATVGAGGVESAGGMTLINSVIAQNSPSGLHLISDTNTILNCTIAHNSAYGIALITSNANTMANSIVWGNSTAGIFSSTSSISISYSDLQDGVNGTGSISANPMFVGPPANLRLGSGSPAVDAGNNAAVPVGVTTDVDGLPRFFNDPSVPDTGAGTPPIVDMGAHERVPLTVSAPSDLDVCAGGPAVFSVVAAGQPTLTYQWRKDGTPLSNGPRISGVFTDTLTIDPAQTDDSDDYDVVVTDGVGQSVDSPDALLTVSPIPATPVIQTVESVAVGSTGNGATVADHAGSTFNWTLSGGTITGGQGTATISFDAGPPGTTMISSVTETNAGCTSAVALFNIQVDFLDVPPDDPFHDFVVDVARNGITAGCGGGNYCRNNPVTREQMAVFLLKAKHGPSYSPPACTGVFDDVTCPSTFANWIEQLSAEGITGGCGPDLYCPTVAVTRAQMAVFLLKSVETPSYVPPACAGVFGDVACPSLFADWIEEIYDREITGGCSASPLLYCPGASNTRGQMAVFLSKAFELE